jgi:hypothetical protein
LPARECGVAYAFCRKEFVVAGYYESVRDNLPTSFFKLIERGVKIRDATLFLRQSAIPVIAKAERQAQVRLDLIFVLEIHAHLVGTVVAIRVPEQECRRGVIVVLVFPARKPAKSAVAMPPLSVRSLRTLSCV